MRPHTHTITLFKITKKKEVIIADNLYGINIDYGDNCDTKSHKKKKVITAYTNYIVGGNTGWFFNATTNTSATNYSPWAANQTFSFSDDNDTRVSSSLVMIKRLMEPQLTPYRTLVRLMWRRIRPS